MAMAITKEMTKKRDRTMRTGPEPQIHLAAKRIIAVSAVCGIRRWFC
jgi:hypothetical protein